MPSEIVLWTKKIMVGQYRKFITEIYFKCNNLGKPNIYFVLKEGSSHRDKATPNTN
jgi:hypothetical protein